MLSTISGFTPDQARRYRQLFNVMLAGVAILLFGVAILCFCRMYAFDSSRYDLFTVFGVMIVGVAAVVISVPVACQLRIFMQVRREGRAASSKGMMPNSGESVDFGPTANPIYAPMAVPQQYPQQYPQPQQTPHRSQMPFSSAAYMMQQQQQHGSMHQRMGAEAHRFDASVASSVTTEKAGPPPLV